MGVQEEAGTGLVLGTAVVEEAEEGEGEAGVEEAAVEQEPAEGSPRCLRLEIRVLGVGSETAPSEPA